MKIINKKYKSHAFLQYLDELKTWRHIDKLVFHHTSSPIDTWRGSASMIHYWTLYKSRGWKTGPHIFVAPDGIWLFSPIKKQGTHAGPEGNIGSIGIEIVGRYFNELPTNTDLLTNLAVVTYGLMKRFKLSADDIKHHLEYHKDGFCSPLLTKEFIIQNMADHYEYLLNLNIDLDIWKKLVESK